LRINFSMKVSFTDISSLFHTWKTKNLTKKKPLKFILEIYLVVSRFHKNTINKKIQITFYQFHLYAW